MGMESDGPYRVTRAQRTPEGDATAALAHRLRLASTETWPGERCDATAAAYVGELVNRGWRPPKPPMLGPDWRSATRDPEATVRGVNLARAMLRGAKTADCGPQGATEPGEQARVGVSGPARGTAAILGRFGGRA